MADGTYREYERDVYRCYWKLDHSSVCTGQAVYKADVIENAVLAACALVFPQYPISVYGQNAGSWQASHLREQ